MEKRIEINENRILLYDVSKGYAKDTYTIKEGILENGEPKKGYYLSQWDDYGLNGWTNDEEDNISFEFDMTHPLYMPLFHLLNYDDELIIDDDTIEENRCFLSIRRNKDKIIMDFVDHTSDSEYIGHVEKFHVFIKNIIADGRSKIDCNHKDTKERLFIFFNEVYELFTIGYHQVTLEEYLLDKDTSMTEMKRLFKRKIR